MFRLFGFIIMTEKNFLNCIIVPEDEYQKAFIETQDNRALRYYQAGKQVGIAEAHGKGTILSIREIENMVERS